MVSSILNKLINSNIPLKKTNNLHSYTVPCINNLNIIILFQVFQAILWLQVINNGCNLL